MKEVLNYLAQGMTLSRDEAKQVLLAVAREEHNSSQVVAFMTAYNMRKPTVDELGGFRAAMLELCERVDLTEFSAIDLCGTGGDGKNTINISTLASFVAAGAGVKVTKHGNVGVSSACGSSNVLEHFGAVFTKDVDVLKRSIEQANICYLHAPLFHPAMKSVAPLRRELGVKTFFNMLGPLVNPACPDGQLAGVFSLELVRMYSYLFQQEGQRYTVVHSLDGYDEVSLTGEVKIVTNEIEKVFRPIDLGFERIAPDAIQGGVGVQESADEFQKILNGDGTDSQNNVVIVNAGLAIFTAGKAKTIEAAIATARESLESKRALTSFQMFLKIYG